MGLLSKLFKSDVVSTKNEKIINAVKTLQNSSLSNSERIDALAKLKSIYLTSTDKDDLKAVSQSILKTVTTDQSWEIRESALKIFDAIIENSLFFYNQSPQRDGSQLRFNIASGDAGPVLIDIAKYKGEDSMSLRQIAFGTLSKIAPFVINDERISFLAASLGDRSDNIRAAVIGAFENIIKSSDDALKRRIARFSLSALCQALDDSTVWARTAHVIEELEKYALGAAPFLYKRLDDKDGEIAAQALRAITGAEYGREEKVKWQQWLQKHIVE